MSATSRAVSGEPEGTPSRRRFSTVNTLAKSMSRLRSRCTDVPLALPLPACGERSEFARSSRELQVRGRLRESELAETSPHPDPLPASGEREKRRHATSDCPAHQARERKVATRPVIAFAAAAL